MTGPNVLYFEERGVRFQARVDTVGTDADEILLLSNLAGTPTGRSRIASLQDNLRHAYEMLLTAPAAGRA